MEGGTTKRERRVPGDALIGEEMMSVTDSRQTRRAFQLHPPPTCTSVIAHSSQMLPHHWQKLSGTHYCKVEEGFNGLGEVTRSVVLDSDFRWNAYVSDKKVPATCDVLARLSPLTHWGRSFRIYAI